MVAILTGRSIRTTAFVNSECAEKALFMTFDRLDIRVGDTFFFDGVDHICLHRDVGWPSNWDERIHGVIPYYRRARVIKRSADHE